MSVANQNALDEQLRTIFAEHFELPTREQIEKEPQLTGKRGWVMAAVEIGVELANIVLSMKSSEPGRHLRSLTSLTFGLNANDFWTKNAPVLLPLLTVTINSHKDAVEMRVDRIKMSEFAGIDKLIAGSGITCLEMFTMLLYLVGGPLLMTTKSTSLKIALAPLLL